jgi:16S rRNA (guanine527-N7)-methyltransferase
LLFGFRKNGSVLDIGAGGGFPSIPINIFRPDLRMILSESNKKKSSFLNEVKQVVGLENIKVFPDRCEKLDGHKYDYVVSRGYASLVHFSQTAKKFLAKDGKMYTFKAKQFAEELEEITTNRQKDGVKISEIAEYDLANQIQGLNLVSLSLC